MVNEIKKTIGVIGLWHLGCVLCASWSKLGNKVVGFDYEMERVEGLKQGKAPIYEPGMDEVIQDELRKGNLVFSGDVKSLEACDFVFLSYDTPVGVDDGSDTGILERAVDDVKRVMKDDAVLVVSSQSPVGFCSLLRSRMKSENPTLELAYSPENLRLGEAIACYLNPGRIVLGTNTENARKKCAELFSQIDADLMTMGLESAEMVKHGINSFLAMSIVFANHLADICEMSGARIDDVVRGMKSDQRIGQKAYLAPGVGFSGGTLGRDLKVLEERNLRGDGDATLFGLIHSLNKERKETIVRRIEKILGEIEGRNIGLLGLTYKPGTSTLRRSLPLEIAKSLIGRGANVKLFDPKADYSELASADEFTIAKNIEEVSLSADALVLLTEWEEFKMYDWENIPKNMAGRIFFDTKNFLNEGEMVGLGFEYHSMGRGPHPS